MIDTTRALEIAAGGGGHLDGIDLELTWIIVVSADMSSLYRLARDITVVHCRWLIRDDMSSLSRHARDITH
jgi:hypothetical protein